MKEGWYCTNVHCETYKQCCETSVGCEPYCEAWKHRKHPTPEQFREEYGREYPDSALVYVTEKWAELDGQGAIESMHWYGRYKFVLEALKNPIQKTPNVMGYENIIICACTPYGMPNDDWEVLF